MKKYKKPCIENIQEYTEGIYMSSGDSISCYTASSHIHQKPETGRGDYRIQINGKHRANHTKEKQMLHIHFNLPVEYISSGGKLISGDGSHLQHCISSIIITRIL